MVRGTNGTDSCRLLVGGIYLIPFFPVRCSLPIRLSPAFRTVQFVMVFRKLEYMFYATGLCLSSSLSTYLTLSIYEIEVLVYNLESK